jgi:hypothetical protein
MELRVERNNVYVSVFSWTGTLQYSIKSLPENGGSPVALVRQPLIIQAREYSTMLITEN